MTPAAHNPDTREKLPICEPADEMMGRTLAYGHAAYCAGWKAAMRCVNNPFPMRDAHSLRWIERNDPRDFKKPLVWRDGTPAALRDRNGQVKK